MVGFLAKPAQTTELAEEADQDSKVKTLKDPLDFSSIDLDFDWVPWAGSSRNIEEFRIEDSDFDFFSDEMEIGQEIIDVSEETSLENLTAVTSEPCNGMIQEIRTKLSGEIGMNLASSEVKQELCDDISVNVDEEIIDVSEETRLENQTTVTSEPCDGVIQEIETNLSGEIGMNLVSSEVKPELSEDVAVNVDDAAVKVSEADIINDFRPIDGNVADDASPDTTLDESELKKTDEALACSIQKGLEKVSLSMENVEKKSDEENKKTDSSDSESETSSASSSTSDSSSSSDEEESDEDESEEEEEKKEEESKEQIVARKESGVVGELEEGEIESVEEELESNISNEDNDDDDEGVDEMIAWSNDEDEDLGLQTKGPIRSKNELKELPPVPAVDVTLAPHHVTLPVGVILSVLGTQVVVMGSEKHNPLNEGSVLWITESRIPLGLVDELFGPVKCPYYIVRYNTESEVPEGISEGTSISFVADFAEHIVKIELLQTKGYDASGDHDEEVSEHEFSDDGEETKHKGQKKEKRGLNEQRTGNKRNKKKNNRDLGRSSSSSSGQWRDNQEPQQTFMSPNLSSNRSDSQPQPHMDRFPPNNGAWRPPQSSQQNPFQQQLPMSNLLPMQLPMIPMQNQMASSNQMMFQHQQFNGGQMPITNLGGPGGLNFFGGQGAAPWAALLGQNCFNQPFGQPHGMVQQQQPPLPNAAQSELNFNLFAAAQGFQMQRPQFQMRPQFQTPMNQQYQMHPAQSPINQQFQIRPQSETSPQSPVNQQFQPETDSQSQGFSSGSSSGRGRSHRGRGRGRGRGRFGRGRGRQQSE